MMIGGVGISHPQMPIRAAMRKACDDMHPPSCSTPHRIFSISCIVYLTYPWRSWRRGSIRRSSIRRTSASAVITRHAWKVAPSNDGLRISFLRASGFFHQSESSLWSMCCSVRQLPSFFIWRRGRSISLRKELQGIIGGVSDAIELAHCRKCAGQIAAKIPAVTCRSHCRR